MDKIPLPQQEFGNQHIEMQVTHHYIGDQRTDPCQLNNIPQLIYPCAVGVDILVERDGCHRHEQQDVAGYPVGGVHQEPV